MAISYTTNGITFSTITVGSQLEDKYGNGNNGDFKFAAQKGVQPFVNAVEIDWNGAQLGDKEINTTGELLSH